MATSIRWPDTTPDAFRSAVVRLLAPDAADRFASAEEFIAAAFGG
jgi:hypothetical protein